jgi:hypothetical protein
MEAEVAVGSLVTEVHQGPHGPGSITRWRGSGWQLLNRCKDHVGCIPTMETGVAFSSFLKEVRTMHLGWIHNMARGVAAGSCLTEVRTMWTASTTW